MSDVYKRYRLYAFYPLLALTTTLLVCISVWNLKMISPHINEITHLWETQPIVSIYVLPQYEGHQCAQDYKPVAIDNNIVSIGKGPCGCAENTLGFFSSSSSCAYNAENSDVCTSLAVLPSITSQAWRQSTVCIKRAGKVAATFKRSYKGRKHPNKHGHCPNGYRKCGDGFNQQEGAICFPAAVECPITNMIIFPSNGTAPVNEGWEPAGEFSASNLTLYVRRQYIDELPIVDLVFQLTHFNKDGENTRGRCYDETSQILNTSAIADSHEAFSYDLTLPDACKSVDARYLLIDQVPLQDHFLQNLQLTKHACEDFALYPLSDPRYQPGLDPDYLNSGVQCDFTSKYTCVRDPYQRTDCAAGDDICDGVANQNVCGEYAHAVRSALPENSGITLGMYFAREVQWTDGCNVGKIAIFQFADNLWLCGCLGVFITCFWCLYNINQSSPRLRDVRFMWDYEFFMFLLVYMVIMLYPIIQNAELYYAVLEGNCTDSFTTDVLLNQLEPAVTCFYFFVVVLSVLFVLAVESFILATLTRQHSNLVITYVGTARRQAFYTLVPIGANPNGYDTVAQVAPTLPTVVTAVATTITAADNMATSADNCATFEDDVSTVATAEMV